MFGGRVVVIGPGYVGLPLAVALARKFETAGFDIDAERVRELIAGHDRTCEVGEQDLRATSLQLTADPQACAGADMYIVTVPTSVDRAKARSHRSHHGEADARAPARSRAAADDHL